MITGTLVFVLTACAGALHWALRRNLKHRIRALERDLLSVSEAMSQMVDIQMKTQKKLFDGLGDLEERFMELSIPSQDSKLPLERRHQVLSLARQGVALGDIVKRLKAPVGEAELILNLQKYMSRDNSQAAKMNQQASPYA